MNGLLLKTALARLSLPGKLLLALFAAMFLAGAISFFVVQSLTKRFAENEIANQMAVEAEIAAHLVNLAKNQRMTTPEINDLLHRVVASITNASRFLDHPGDYEFWITQTQNVATLRSRSDLEMRLWEGMTNELGEVTNGPIKEFVFGESARKQSRPFLELFRTGGPPLVTQPIMQREIDDKEYKYVGVRGVDPQQPQIVQVGYPGSQLRNDFFRNSFIIAGVGFGVNIVLAGIFIYLLANSVILRPVRCLTKRAESLLDPEAQTQRTESHHGDELEVLSGVIARLEEHFTKREEDYVKAAEAANRDNRIVLHLRGGRIMYCNEVAAKTFGYHVGELTGQSVEDIIPSAARAEVKAALDRVGVEPSVNFNENVTKDGHRLWVLWQNTKHEALGVKDAGLLCVGTDMSSLIHGQGASPLQAKEVSRFMEEMAGELEAERSHIAQLTQETAELTRESKLKDNLLDQVNHELTGPLYGILEYIRQLKDTLPESEQLEPLSLLESCASRLRVVVDDLYNFAVIKQQGIKLCCAPFDLRRSCEAAIGDLKGRATDHGLQFSIEIESSLPQMVLGDHVRLEQALTNLIRNAVYYTEEGFVRVSVKLESENQQEVCIRFQVDDSGPGIPESERNTIFEAFRRLDQSEKRRVDGVGIGLTIARVIVQAMHGDIHVDHGPNEKGSRFWFSVCLSKVKAGVLPTSAPQEEKAQGPLPGTGQIALVVENEDAIRPATMYGFKQLGFEVLEAGSGKKAIEHWANHSPEVIVMDVYMPGMDGIEATAEIRRQESSSKPATRTLICAVTAHRSPERRQRCLAAGFDEVFSKPPDWDEIRRFLDERSQQRLETVLHKDFWDNLENFSRMAALVQAGLCTPIRSAIEGSAWVEAQRATHELGGLVGHFKDPGARRQLDGLRKALKVEDRAAALAQTEALRQAVQALRDNLDRFLTAKKGE